MSSAGPSSTTDGGVGMGGGPPGSSSSGDAASTGGLDSRSPGAHSREENCLSEDNDTMDTGLGEFPLIFYNRKSLGFPFA